MNHELIGLLSAAVRDRAFSPEEERFIKDALLSWLGGEKTLDHAFGLAGVTPGQRSAQSRLIHTLRDGRVKDAAMQLGMKSRREASKELSRRWTRLADGKPASDATDAFLKPAALLSRPLAAHSIRRILGG